jgi:hypothetical protein
MARLIVKPDSPSAWEIQLKPGLNYLGRGFANDFKIDDPSVSGSHCQITIENGNAVIKDLGSTNGTFVNRSPVQEAPLQSGQTIHLGGLDMLFESDAPPPPPPPPAVARPSLAITARPSGRLAVTEAETTPPVVTPPIAPAIPQTAFIGSQNCKHHPKTAGRYLCNKCHLAFCELCVTSRAQRKYCRHCGSELAPLQVKIQRPTQPKGFFTRLPGAFVYPFKGSGALILIVASLLFAGLRSVGGFAILLVMAALGYLFSYMQNIIHCTASEDDEMPSLPAMDGLFGAFFTFAGTVVFCFGIPIGLFVAKFFSSVDIPGSALVATMVLSCLYFPMAFLAVAMKDSVMAANPLVVVPAILKVPLEYLVTAILLTCVFLVRMLGDAMSSVSEQVGYHTRDMSVLFMTIGVRAVWSLLSVYLLTVGMRILGLLYATKKEKFGWFSH